MRHLRSFVIPFTAMLVLSACATSSSTRTVSMDTARRLASEFIIVDGHVDVPYRVTEVFYEDVAQRTVGGDFDYARARAGGLDAPFMSIYVPSELQERGNPRAYADSLIDFVEGLARAAPDRFRLARSVADVHENHRAGLVSLPMGMENGAPIGQDLANLRHFFDRGIRYITLAHAKNNQLSDAAYDSTRRWNGLSPFGREVVREMNRLGVMIDVSHLSDSAFYQVLALSSAPVIASHSSARTFTPGWERNMSDDMIRALAAQGGVIMINFGSAFLRSDYDRAGGEVRSGIMDHLTGNGMDRSSPEGWRYFSQQRRAKPIGTIDDVVLHIRHVADLVGSDHVGFGSDFDGVFALPRDLQDVSDYPKLIRALLNDGFSEEEVRNICGENALRVWSEVERIAAAEN